MTPLLNTLLFSPLLLLILSIQDPTEACRCALADPQQQICSSDIVIRATIRSKEEIIDSASSLKIIQYEIKQIKITACHREPCPIATPNECLWTDWLKGQTVYGHQANNCACFKGSDGTCSWH
ncbi:Metalloproteinase inhibitor 4, partial [Ophiophagus hannah]